MSRIVVIIVIVIAIVVLIILMAIVIVAVVIVIIVIDHRQTDRLRSSRGARRAWNRATPIRYPCAAFLRGPCQLPHEAAM